MRASKIQVIDIENVENKKERLAALVAMFLSGRAANSCYSVGFDNIMAVVNIPFLVDNVLAVSI